MLDNTCDRLPEVGFVRLEAIIGSKNRAGLIPISKTAWYSGIRAGIYPSPVKHGRCSLWRVEDIRHLISRIEAGIAAFEHRTLATCAAGIFPPRAKERGFGSSGTSTAGCRAIDHRHVGGGKRISDEAEPRLGSEDDTLNVEAANNE